MPFQTIPNLGLQYALISFDDEGLERTDDPEGGVFSRVLAEKVKHEQPSHVFLFSHGWKGDVPSAIDQYDRWIGAMWGLKADQANMGPDFRPLFIGLHWPSQPWGEEVISATANAFGTAAGLAVDALFESAVKHFGDRPAVRAPLKVIFGAFERDPGAKTLPDEAVAAYHDLAAAIGFSSGRNADAAPDCEGAPLDPQAAVRAEKMANLGASFGVGATIKNGILAGLRQPSFWLMKHRARKIGEEGMHSFVSQLQQTSNADIHLMGHSFGCIVMSSILGGPGGKGRLPRPINSAALIQGALSLWSYADRLPDSTSPGYFRDVLTNGAVSGPIVTTQSIHDSAVGLAYPAAVGLVDEVDFGVGSFPTFGGVGTWGIQGTTVAESGKMLDEQGTYRFQPGRVYNVDSSPFIPSHSGIASPQVAHLLWQAAQPLTKGQHP